MVFVSATAAFKALKVLRPERAGKSLPATPDAFRRALDTAPWTLGLYHARPAGHWIRFGTLELTLDPAAAGPATERGRPPSSSQHRV
ncbi:hypothetical protein [Arthrobacter oryzae]|uniref:hypothetical protein n=1 Tax=Arthrobacter oryzae TaxID=409290 RepID=UPI0011CEC41D|nr:hypothetical protein [Arthrobacter oryzae]